MFPLIWSLLRPYRLILVIILFAMLLQMVASVAVPWPLKIILDNVLGRYKLPDWLNEALRPFMNSGTKMQIAAAAAVAVVLIAVLGAIASYTANYYTTSVGQWVANDLRLRTYHRLHSNLAIASWTLGVAGTQRLFSSGGMESVRNAFLDRGHPEYGRVGPNYIDPVSSFQTQ